MLLKYNPKKINGSWNNVKFLGYMDGNFIEVEYNEDQVTSHVGGVGDLTLVLNPNMTAKAVVTLIQGSPTNQLLSNMLPNAKTNTLITGMFSLADLNGTTLVSSANACLQKMAKVEFGKSISGRAWTFILPDASIVAGAGGT